jgi:hypothetical protein
MKKFYLFFFYILIHTAFSLLPEITYGQSCSTLTASYTETESRCAATGTIQINATGGSGNYQYKVAGPVVTNFTSSSLITGLLAGRYLITVKDIVTNCIYDNDSVTVAGSYLAPNFTMASTDVTCINGNDGSITVNGQTFGRAPFSYTIIAPSASGVGTVSATGVFTGLTSGSYLIQLSDSCGAIQTRSAIIQNYDWYINNHTVTKIGCDSIAVTINLKDSKGNVTPSPVFNGFTYGASATAGDTTWFTTNIFKYYKGNTHTVKLFVKDNCGNIKSFVWTDTAIPKVGSSVSITNKVCATFTATITGQVNLTSPEFCLYDSVNSLLLCNSTGVFNLLPYGSYCITIRDSCYDTTITKCFTVIRPVPAVAANVHITPDCKNFTATVTGQTNLTNPDYCLYDLNNVLMYCNTSGVFTDLSYGSYCIKIFNDSTCYDTTIIRCFTVTPPVPYVGPNVPITNLSCSTFTATISDTVNLNDPQYCLYTSSHVLIVCNSTGVFNNLPFGTYCIDVINNTSCYDTTITRCFTVNRPIPSVGASVTISNKTCTTFTAAITGQVNLNNPQYCIYDNLNAVISCNTTGVFANLPFGAYCIKIQNNTACYDTLISKCFTVAVAAADISVSAKKSCSIIGTTDLKVTINSGVPAYSISLFSPTGVLIQTITTSSSSYTFLNLPALTAALKYKVVITDQCSNKDSVSVTPNTSVLNRLITVTPKCPSGIWPNGSADVLVNVTNNIGGDAIPKVIKKDGVVISVNASSASGNNFTFLDMGPATYIFDTYVDDCNKHIYDTVVVREYVFPVLSGSNAYQCDNNSFSVSVNVSGGSAPYTYEIIGSVPSSPSIITSPQASSSFSINNGTIYSLIRLRVIDACGNASLYDVSVMPLANFLVFADTIECIDHSLTLRVDSIGNAAYTWYKRIEPNDSLIIGTGPSLYFPNLLQSDTGRYFCKVVINNGCLIKYASYILTATCYGVLPVNVSLAAIKQADGNKLFWNFGVYNIRECSLQRSVIDNTVYQKIYTFVNTQNNVNIASYFIDKSPYPGNNYYRLKFIDNDNSIKFSNVVLMRNTNLDISIYPNPVDNMLFFSIKNSVPKNYLVEICNMIGKKVMSKTYTNVQNLVVEYPRSKSMVSGVYVLNITDLQTKERKVFKIIYK